MAAVNPCVGIHVRIPLRVVVGKGDFFALVDLSPRRAEVDVAAGQELVDVLPAVLGALGGVAEKRVTDVQLRVDHRDELARAVIALGRQLVRADKPRGGGQIGRGFARGLLRLRKGIHPGDGHALDPRKRLDRLDIRRVLDAHGKPVEHRRVGVAEVHRPLHRLLHLLLDLLLGVLVGLRLRLHCEGAALARTALGHGCRRSPLLHLDDELYALPAAGRLLVRKQGISPIPLGQCALGQGQCQRQCHGQYPPFHFHMYAPLSDFLINSVEISILCLHTNGNNPHAIVTEFQLFPTPCAVRPPTPPALSSGGQSRSGRRCTRRPQANSGFLSYRTISAAASPLTRGSSTSFWAIPPSASVNT